MKFKDLKRLASVTLDAAQSGDNAAECDFYAWACAEPGELAEALGMDVETMRQAIEASIADGFARKVLASCDKRKASDRAAGAGEREAKIASLTAAVGATAVYLEGPVSAPRRVAPPWTRPEGERFNLDAAVLLSLATVAKRAVVFDLPWGDRLAVDARACRDALKYALKRGDGMALASVDSRSLFIRGGTLRYRLRADLPADADHRTTIALSYEIRSDQVAA